MEILTKWTSLRKGVIQWVVEAFGSINWMMVSVLVICFLASISVGFVIGFSAIFLPQFTAENANVTTAEKSAMVSIANIGQMLGSVLGGYLANIIGRQRTILLVNTFGIVGWIMIAASFDHVALISIGRFLCGFGIVTATVQCLLSIVGGCTVHLVRLASGTCGILLVYVMGWAMPWKWVAAAAAITTMTISLFVFFVVPESPAWLFHQGDTAASRTSLSLLRNVHIAVVEPEIRHLEEAAAKNKMTDQSKVSPTARFQSMNWPIIKATSLALVIQFLVQFSGANAVSAYAVNMAETVGFTAEPYLPAVSITALRIGGSILSLLILSMFKRRITMITTSVVMGVALATASGLLFLRQDLDEDIFSFGCMACIGIYLIAFSSGAGAIPWFLAGELVPIEFRSLVSGLSIAVACLSIFASVFTYGYFDKAISLGGTFIIYSGTTAVLLVLVATFLPETKGITEVQIQGLFRDNKENLTKADA